MYVGSPGIHRYQRAYCISVRGCSPASYTDPDKGTWTYQYDENGNLTYQQDAKGNIVRFEYDALNRPSVKKHDTTTVSSYTYKITGQLDTVTYAGGSDSFTYTPRGQVNVINRAITGYGTKSMSMTYDSMGRVATQTYPDGEVVTNTYNASGNLETMAGASSYVTNVDYNEYGKVTNFAFGNGKTTIYAYNNLNGRMTDLDVAGVLDNHYTYDLVGNITRRDDNINTAYTETFAYDELYRLTSAQGYYGTKVYTYDAYGNITSKDGMVYSYPAVGGVQPHGVTSDGTNTYAYDANGNMTTGKGRTLTYDSENRVTQITKDGVTTTMGYDDSGERLTKTVGNTVVVYWFRSFEEKYISGSLNEATKYYSANGQPVAQRSTVSGLLYIHRDHLGSVSKLTNASGVVVQTMEYIPYGTKTYASGGEYTDYGYSGQENDPSTGLYYFHARYYDPELGRFMQADTVLDGVNRYTYCGNNPVMYTDPTGTEYIDPSSMSVDPTAYDDLSDYNQDQEQNCGVDSGDSSGDPGTGGASTAGGTGNQPGTGSPPSNTPNTPGSGNTASNTPANSSGTGNQTNNPGSTVAQIADALAGFVGNNLANAATVDLFDPLSTAGKAVENTVDLVEEIAAAIAQQNALIDGSKATTEPAPTYPGDIPSPQQTVLGSLMEVASEILGFLLDNYSHKQY